MLRLLVSLLEVDRSSTGVATILPWGVHKERTTHYVDVNIKPGEFVMRTLFADFAQQADQKIEAVLAEPQVNYYFGFH